MHPRPDRSTGPADHLHREITASGTFQGRRHDAVVTQTFVTGWRRVTLFFGRINVRKDGDPAGAGEFEFQFSAGDADGGAELGYAVWGEGDISDDDPPVDVNRVVAIDQAPRSVYALVLGVDEDRMSFRPAKNWPTSCPRSSSRAKVAGGHRRTTTTRPG